MRAGRSASRDASLLEFSNNTAGLSADADGGAEAGAEHHLQAWWVENSDKTQNSKLNKLLTARSPEALVAAALG